MFRNHEIKKFAIADILILIIFLIFLNNSHIKYNITILFFAQWLMLNITFYILLKYRYNKLSNLAFEIDKTLHSNEISNIHYLDEGELNILGSEINKMILRINEQNRELQEDKVYLVNSLADISHQIKTPLTSLQLTNTLLISNSSDTKSLEHLITEKKLIMKIQWLIDVILKISKLDANVINFTQKEHRLDTLINYTLEPILVLIDVKNINIVTNIPDGTTLNCDFKWISEAMLNIIKNCIEHTEENGTITISATDNPLFLEINITDTGKGFAKEDIPHLFERFYKGENSSKDSIGIGLSLAKSIINSHNGIIMAKNQIDTNNNIKGACFTIKFYKTTI